MSKAIVLLSVLLISLNAYKLTAVKEKSLKNIPWPFTLCGDGTWTPESLELGVKPVRSANNEIKVVLIVLFRLEQPMMTFRSQECTWMST